VSKGKEAPVKQPKHCDEYIHDHTAPMCLRWFLYCQRVPAIDGVLMRDNGVNPRLFARFDGTRVRVVMASRMGDVGITDDLTAENGYSIRVNVEELTDFTDDDAGGPPRTKRPSR
jgi:hypothetical protein